MTVPKSSKLPRFTTPTDALLYAARHGIHIRIFYGDPATGKDDCNEVHRIGKIKKTRAEAFILQQDKGNRGMWMHTIDTTRVVRVASYRRKKPAELYRHPEYSPGDWSSYYNSTLERWVAARNELIHATFDTEAEAALYIDYIIGNRVQWRKFTTVAFEALKRRTRKGIP